MKRRQSLLLFVFIGMFLFMNSFTPYADNIIEVSVDDNILQFESQPILENGTVLVPMRKIFEALHADVEWVTETKQIIATNDDSCIILTIGSTVVQKDGTDINLLVAPRIINGSTYVPVRFIAESLNSDVLWNGVTQTVTIKSKQKEEKTKVYTDYVPYGTSDLKTLAENILKGNVVYFNGQYWATPEYATLIANEEIVYMNDVSGETDIENRYEAAELKLEDVFNKTDWIEQNSIFLEDVLFEYGNIYDPNDRKFIKAGYFYRQGLMSIEYVYILKDMTEVFAKIQNSEDEFNGIRIKKVGGEFHFYKEDLIDKGIIE